MTMLIRSQNPQSALDHRDQGTSETSLMSFAQACQFVNISPERLVEEHQRFPLQVAAVDVHGRAYFSRPELEILRDELRDDTDFTFTCDRNSIPAHDELYEC